MQLRPEQVDGFLRTHQGVLGPGWKEVNSFDELEDEDEEYEYEETEEYITLDLGRMDARYLQTEATLQLIGLDTGLPHLKIGNAVLQGEVTPLIGSEVLLGLIRNHENPHNPSHPPVHATSHRVTFRPIQLWHNSDPGAHIHQLQTQSKAPSTAFPSHSTPGPNHMMQTHTQTPGSEVPDMMETAEPGETEARSMFLQRPAKNGPNRPEVFPGRQRDRFRAEMKAEKGKEREMMESGQHEQDHHQIQVQVQTQSESRDQGTARNANAMDGKANEDGDDQGMEIDEDRPVDQPVTEEEMAIDPALMDIDSINPNPVEPIVETDQRPDQAYRMDRAYQSHAPPALTSPTPISAPIAATTPRDADPTLLSRPVSMQQANPSQDETRQPPSSSPSTQSGLTTPNFASTSTPNPPVYPYPGDMYESGPTNNADIFTSSPGAGPSTPGNTSGTDIDVGVGLPSLDTQLDPGADMFATGPRSLGRQYKGGRPRTRPLLEIHRADQLTSTNINYLPDNVRILVSPLALGLVPIQAPDSDVAPPTPQSPQSLEFTKTAFRRWLTGTPNSGAGSRGGAQSIRAKPTPTPTPRDRTASDSAMMERPGSGPSSALGTGTGTEIGLESGMGTPTPIATAKPKPRPSARSVAMELRKMDKPFLMTVGADSPRPSPRTTTTTTTTTTNMSMDAPSQNDTGTAATPVGTGNGNPPEDLEPEARKDLEEMQDAEALEALREAIQRSG